MVCAHSVVALYEVFMMQIVCCEKVTIYATTVKTTIKRNHDFPKILNKNTILQYCWQTFTLYLE